MSIRRKFFLVLMAFSLIPLLAVAVVSQGNIKQLGAMLSAGARDSLTRTVSNELQQTAEHGVRQLIREAQALRFAVQVLAAKAEHALSQPASPAPKVFFAGDFASAAQAPPDLVPSDRHLAVLGERGLAPVPTSFEHPVFILAPGADVAPDDADIARLRRLAPFFKRSYKELEPAVHRIYVALERGIHTAYPGHGNYPAGYDPRLRPWYTGAMDRQEVGWQSMVDAGTGQIVFTVSMPVRRPDGQPAGVAAIDYLVNRALHIEELHHQWSAEAQAMLVTIADNPVSGSMGLQIWGQSRLGQYTVKTAAVQWLQSPDARPLSTLTQAIATGQSGYLQMKYQGVESLIGYAVHQLPSKQPLGLMVIVPQPVVMAIPHQAEQRVLAISHRFYLTAAAATSLTILLTSIVALFGARSITRPLLEAVSAWQRLSQGDFSVRLNPRYRDERDLVYQAFNETVPKLEALFHVRQSLELAREVQHNLLPRRVPVVAGYDIAGSSHYCEETGGDYFDFIETTEAGQPRLTVFVGDVSGHGVPAALLMATARALLRGAVGKSEDLAASISKVNALLTGDTGSTGNFITLFCLALDPQNHRIDWVRAGHDPALWYDPALDTVQELGGAGMALGINGKYTFTSTTRDFDQPGQTLLIGTDGIWEARSAGNSLFGKERLKDLMRRYKERSAQELMAAIIAAVNLFRGERPQEDDITLVVIKRI